jgi:hypothetical protein
MMSACTRWGCFAATKSDLRRNPARQRVARQGDLLGELVDDVREVVERTELMDRRHRTVAEARVIRRHKAEPIRQCRYQVPKHMRRGREAVQQQHDRCAARARLSVEHVEAVDLDRFGTVDACRSYRRLRLLARPANTASAQERDGDRRR